MGARVYRDWWAQRGGRRLVEDGVKVHRFTVDPRPVPGGLSEVGENGIPGVTVESVEIGKDTNGEGRSLGRY